jgi:hypothetical protein
MNPPAKRYKNRILAALPKAELDRLKPHLSPVTLKVRAPLLDGHAATPSTHIFWKRDLRPLS